MASIVLGAGRGQEGRGQRAEGQRARGGGRRRFFGSILNSVVKIVFIFVIINDVSFETP